MRSVGGGESAAPTAPRPRMVRQPWRLLPFSRVSSQQQAGFPPRRDSATDSSVEIKGAGLQSAAREDSGTSRVTLLLVLLLSSFGLPASAEVPSLINYQGRVAVGAVNFDGTGAFKFALVDGGHTSIQAAATATRNLITKGVDAVAITNPGSGYTSPPSVRLVGGGGGHGATAIATLTAGSVTSIAVINSGTGYNAAPTVVLDAPPPNYAVTYWSNDGTSTVANEPVAAVSLRVVNGLYSVPLGDATLTNMIGIPASVFAHGDVRLRVWFDDRVHGMQLLSPDQRIAAVGYAMSAAGLNLPATTDANTGVIRQGGASLIHTYGLENFFAGQNAGNFSSGGEGNTGTGFAALAHLQSGEGNTACGVSTLAANGTGFGDTAVGAFALSQANGGTGNIALGFKAGLNITTESYNIDIGNLGSAGDSGVIRLGDPALNTATYLVGNVVIPSASVVGNILVDGYIFNKWGGAYLSLGDGGANTPVVWRSSDARLKEKVETIPDALGLLSRLRGVKYQWNKTGQQHLTRDIEKRWRAASGTDEDNRKLWAEKRAEALATLDHEQTGFVAQELETVFPSWVRTDEQGYRQINIEQLAGVIVQGVNELNTRIQGLDRENTALRQRLGELEAREKNRASRENALAERLAKLEQHLLSTPPVQLVNQSTADAKERDAQ